MVDRRPRARPATPRADGARGSRRRFVRGAALLLAACSFGLAACDGSGEPSVTDLSLERLAFVPRGRAALFGDLPCAAERDLVVDRYEVTRGLWREVYAATRGALPALDELLARAPESDGDDWPAAGMSFEEARRFAEARDMRLLSVGEWMYVAVGSRAQYWPYGNSREASVANVQEVGLDRPTAVGTFPNGRTADTGVEDMLGNLWEWTAPPLLTGVSPSTWWQAGRPPGAVWVMGGAYTTPARPLWGRGVDGRRVLLARAAEFQDRASDVGLRCCADAERYLATHASAWSTDAWRDRVQAVGHRWGPRAVPLLERLVGQPGAARALRWLLEGARS